MTWKRKERQIERRGGNKKYFLLLHEGRVGEITVVT